MAGRGRPTTLTEEHKTRALTFASMGWSQRACARAAGVSWDTFSSWLAKNPDFSAELTRASMDCGAVATDSLMKACRNGEQWAVTFLLSRRFRNDFGSDERQDDARPARVAFEIVPHRPAGDDDAS